MSCLDIFKLRWAIITGVLTGVIISTAGTVWVPTALAAYDKLSPVVAMKGEVIEDAENQLILHITGEKLRTCQFLSINSYGYKKEGNLKDLSITRIDRPDERATKPKGNWDMGIWKIWSTEGITSVMVVTSHNCEGRLINTKIAEVVLVASR